jgi:protein-S-isoprenylcysteine O-methyltransferase Ste14
VKLLVALRAALYAAAFVSLWAWVGLALRRFDERLPVTLPASLAPLAWLLLATGAAVAALCVAVFVARGDGTPAPFDPPRRFVATGPYRYVRNPMYLGAFAMLLGLGLLLRSPSMTALAFAFLLLAHLFVVGYEERQLAGRFGESYVRYRLAVRRWLPPRPASSAGPGAG